MLGAVGIMGTPRKRQPRYVLVSGLVSESLGEKSLIFIPGDDLILTVNESAVCLLELLQEWFGESSFSENDLAGLIFNNYRLSRPKAKWEAALIIKSCLKYRLLERT
jgi:hypothetical protein